MQTTFTNTINHFYFITMDIFNYVNKQRGGHYVHAIEVESLNELENSILCLYDELIRQFDHVQVLEFLSTLQIYCLDELQEDEVYNFDVDEFINTLN